MKTIRVLIVDDHEMVRNGLRHLLETEDDLTVVGEASDGIRGVALAKNLRPDIGIFDISMPKMGGLEMICLLKQSLPQMKVIILSMFSKESFAQEALQAGAQAYVLKGAPGSDLLQAIRAVNAGGFYFSKEIHARVVSSYLHRQERSQTPAMGYHSLSDREKQVFRLLIEGNTTAEIAKILCIGIKTAEKHRTSLTKKLGISSIVDMMKYAIRSGLVDPETWQN